MDQRKQAQFMEHIQAVIAGGAVRAETDVNPLCQHTGHRRKTVANDMQMNIHQTTRAVRESGMRAVISRGLVGSGNDEGGQMRLRQMDMDAHTVLLRLFGNNFQICLITGVWRMGPQHKGAVAAHCVQIDEADMDILKAKNVSVVTNPASNMKLGNGFAPVAGGKPAVRQWSAISDSPW